jgi:aspartate aminotransferase
MASYIDSVPLSGIIRIRDMMYSVQQPYRLDQGDVSFDCPDSVKEAMVRAIANNQTHYMQTTGFPLLRALLAEKLQQKNRIPADAEHVLVTHGGIHGLYVICRALLEPGDEVLIPDPQWPPAAGNILAAQGIPVRVPLHEQQGWRYDMDELAAAVTPRTKILYLNSPHNPTGGVLARSDLEQLAEFAERHDLWVISDEAYEDVIYEGAHTSLASLPGLYDRTIPLFTLSKTYAMTGLRLGYVAIRDTLIRERATKILFYTASNVVSIVQHGAIGALQGPQDCIEAFRTELRARRDLFYRGVDNAAAGLFTGTPPAGAFYAFLRIDPRWPGGAASTASLSWRLVEHLIQQARVGCVPGVDFGPHGEGYVRFCFARDPQELTGALDSMRAVFAAQT